MDLHPSLFRKLLFSELDMKLPPTSSPGKQGEAQQGEHSAQPPIPACGQCGQPLSLTRVKLFLPPVEETSREEAPNSHMS